MKIKNIKIIVAISIVLFFQLLSGFYLIPLHSMHSISMITLNIAISLLLPLLIIAFYNSYSAYNKKVNILELEDEDESIRMSKYAPLPASVASLISVIIYFAYFIAAIINFNLFFYFHPSVFSLLIQVVVYILIVLIGVFITIINIIPKTVFNKLQKIIKTK
jgi:hypothetical protein